MSHALATVLHRGHKAASNLMSACLASSRGSTLPGAQARKSARKRAEPRSQTAGGGRFGHGLGYGLGKRKRKAPQMRGFSANNFPAATYSPTPQGCSTIGPEGLSCRVRNGIGRFPHGMTTGKKLQPPPSHINAQTKQSNKRNKCGQASRPISTGQLHVLPRFHTPPINQVVYLGSSGAFARETLSWSGLPA